MGLLDKLTTTGTPYSYNNGTTPITNPGATTLSKLHVDGNQPSYSINGTNFADVNTAFQAYNDGVNNILPQPSQLDLNGTTPSKYIDNIPG
jgi:hypothetical protein